MKTYYIESLGCAKNLVDSEVFAHHLQMAGLEPAEDAEGANLVLINTCAFLQSSLAEFDEILSSYAELKNQGEIEQLLVSGCVMNRALEDFIDIFPEVDAWIPLQDFKALDHFLKRRKTGNDGRKPLENNYYRYLRVSDGCANNCSYCTIPSIRGGLKSKIIPKLVLEARALSLEGTKELILIAQDTAMYGRDQYGYQALPKLLEELGKFRRFHWLRTLYLHPDHFEISWLRIWKDNPKILPYFEIPIQHSEDHILQKMNRRLGRAELKELFARIREVLPTAVFRTTLISGFPGETAIDHRNLMDFIREVPFLHLGVFAYSREPGTPAYDMSKQVNEEVAERRRDELLNLHRELMSSMLESYVGQSIEVLVESVVEPDPESGTDETTYIGRAWFQAPEIDGVVFISGGEAQPGTFIQVEVVDVIDVDLFARIKTEN